MPCGLIIIFIIELLLIYIECTLFYFILTFRSEVMFVFKNLQRGGKIEKIVFQVRITLNEMNIPYSYISLCYTITYNKIAIINYYYRGTWGIPHLRDSVKSSGYSRVMSNFISIYTYGARSSVSFLTARRDERS